MSVEVEPAPAPVAVKDALEVAIEQRETARGKKAPAKGHAPKPAPADTAEPDEDAPATGDKPKAADTPAKEPAPVEPSEPKYVPAEIRAKLPTLAPEVEEWLKANSAYEKRYKDLQAEFSKRTEADKVREDSVAKWERLLKSPRAAKAAMDIMEEEAGGKPAAEPVEEWDFDSHTAADNWKHIKTELTSENEAKAEAQVSAAMEKASEPERRRIAIGNALAQFAQENGKTEAEMLKAIGIAKVQALDLKLEWTTENAARLVSLGFGLMPNREANTPAAKPDAPGLARVASPPTKGVGTSAPAIPKWKRDGLKWPKSNEDRAAFFNSDDLGDTQPES